MIGETSLEDIIPYIQRNVTRELTEQYPELKAAEGFTATLANAAAAAYMTGILPIKKDGSQSAISDFQEYSMLGPRQFAEYVGFTEEEVKRLCCDYGSDFDGLSRTVAELIGGAETKVDTKGSYSQRRDSPGVYKGNTSGKAG